MSELSDASPSGSRVPGAGPGAAAADAAGVAPRLGALATISSTKARLAARVAPLARRPQPPPDQHGLATGGDYAGTGAAIPSTTGQVEPAPGPAGAGPAPRRSGDVVIKQSAIRRRISRNLRHSLDTATHTLVVVEVDYSAVEAVRAAHKLSYLPFVARAVVEALREFPQVNSSLDGDELVVHQVINLGISVDLNFEGLVVPVVREADLLRLEALAARLREVAAAARQRQLGADDLQGGTFTITNAGSYGTVVTVPIINPPQVAILSTDGVRMRPVAIPDGSGGWSIAVRPIGNLSLSFDHRAFDGAYAAAFVAHVRDTLVARAWESEL